MLFLLIALAWLAVAAFFVMLCHVAARGDAAPAEVPERARTRVVGGGLTVRELHSERLASYG